MRGVEERKALVEATRDMSAVAAAAAVGVSVATIYKWRKGPEYAERVRADAGDVRHGTWNGYANYDCRCDRCVRAGHDYYVSRKKTPTPG